MDSNFEKWKLDEFLKIEAMTRDEYLKWKTATPEIQRDIVVDYIKRVAIGNIKHWQDILKMIEEYQSL
jgi:hypothetical protein